jgi:nucleoside phosphorylase
MEFTPLLASLERYSVPNYNSLPSGPPRPDLVLVTVNEHETRAVHDAFFAANGLVAKPITLGSRIYHDLGKIGETAVYHAISEMGSVGVGAMLQTVDGAINDLEPGAVIAVGIAFGVNQDKQKIGDILVSQRLISYEPARISNLGEITCRGPAADSSPRQLPANKMGRRKGRVRHNIKRREIN